MSDQMRVRRAVEVIMGTVLNVTDPVIACDDGKAAFDAVGPLLLIGWSDVGPGLLQGMSSARVLDAA